MQLPFLLLSCLLSVALGEGEPVPQEPPGYVIPTKTFIDFCICQEKAEAILNAEAECTKELNAQMLQSQTGDLDQTLFMRFMHNNFGQNLCILNKVGVLSADGQMDKNRIVEFFTNDGNSGVFESMEDKCMAEAEEENINHFFQSWEDMYKEIRSEIQKTMNSAPKRAETELDDNDRRLNLRQRMKKKLKALRKKQKSKAAEVNNVVSTDADDICNMKDMLPKSKVTESGQELDVLEEYCKLPREVKQSVKEAMKPLVFWRCVKESKYLLCAQKLNQLMRDNGATCSK